MRKSLSAVSQGVILLFLVGSFSFLVDGRVNASGFRFSLEDSLYRLLGTAKEAIGDTLFLKADATYHGGVQAPLVETKEEHEREGLIGAAERAEAPDWIAAINARVKSHEHTHLTKEEQVEMLPFFALATRLDPHNVEAILTTAYWLEKSFGKTDEAIEVLETGSRENPKSWETDFQLAGLYFRRKNDWERSSRYYRRAIQKADPKTVERHFLIDMHYFLAESYRNQGKRDEALLEYRKALGFYGPEEGSLLKDKIGEKIGDSVGN